VDDGDGRAVLVLQVQAAYFGGEMRIKAAKATGWPELQFVVYAETDEDRVILAQASRVHREAYERKLARFWLHGIGPNSFNFGWLDEKYFKKTPKANPKPKRKSEDLRNDH